MRDWLRVGDPVGSATSTANDLVEAIPAGDAIAVPIVSLEVTDAPDDLTCALVSRPHVWASVTRDVTVQVPRDMDLRAVYDVTPSGAVPVHNYSVSERSVTLRDVRTDDAMPARVFLLAGSEDAADRIDAAMSAF